MKEFTASSGARVKIGVSGWEDTNILFMTALREAAKSGVNLKGMKLSKDMDIGPLLASLLMVISSPEVYACLWPCLERSTYNGMKINKGTFEDPKNRQDYLEIIKEFFVVNITPFLPKNFLQLWGEAKTMLEDTQKPT